MKSNERVVEIPLIIEACLGDEGLVLRLLINRRTVQHLEDSGLPKHVEIDRQDRGVIGG